MLKRTKGILAAAAVFALAVLPFSRAVRYGIVNCDDYDYVRRHQMIPKSLSVEGMWKVFSGEVAAIHGIWMPLTWISYMVDGSIAKAIGLKEPDASENGPSAANVMHVHSIILHGVNAVLLWWLLVTVFGSGLRIPDCWFWGAAVAAFAALFWAVHPLRVESAVWVASRKDVLSGMWMLLALIFWVRKRPMTYLLSMVCFAMAGMAKPSVMSFPALCLILDVLILRRLRPIDYAVPVLAATGLGVFAAQMQAAGGATNDLADVPAWGRLLNAAAAFGMYLKNTVWPTSLAVQCMHRWPALPRFVWPGLVLSVAAAWWLGRGLLEIWDRRSEWFKRMPDGAMPEYGFAPEARPVFAGCLWFAVAVAPMLGLANFGYHAFADRFTYIPAMGLSIAVTAAMLKMRRRTRPVGAVAAVTALMAFGALTWRQTGFWRSDRVMWEHTMAVDGDNSAVAHASLALYHFEFTHDLDTCILHYRRAFELKPMFVEGTRHLYQFALCEKGLLDEAREELAEAQRWSMRQNDIVDGKIKGMNLVMERSKMPPYALSRIAYFIVAPGMLKAAEDELAAMPKPVQENVNVQYLQARLAEVKGEQGKADAMYRKIVREEKATDYVRFRYLAKKYGKE